MYCVSGLLADPAMKAEMGLLGLRAYVNERLPEIESEFTSKIVVVRRSYIMLLIMDLIRDMTHFHPKV